MSPPCRDGFRCWGCPAVSGEVSTAATGRCRAGPWPFGLLEGVDPARPAPRPPMTVTLACPCCVCGNGHGKHQGVSGVVAEHIREPFCGSRLVCLSIVLASVIVIVGTRAERPSAASEDRWPGADRALSGAGVARLFRAGYGRMNTGQPEARRRASGSARSPSKPPVPR